MKFRHVLAAVVAVSALATVPVMAQTDHNSATHATKQKTQGTPPGMNNPPIGPDAGATRQKAQGAPASLVNPQYGTQANKEQGGAYKQ
ncbi:MAG: hypothetical protein B7Z80_07715 [Rhodospirillales bacterium 20-64-7]|nr:MAG: hypothetical protein B7Z80_07715 [Rhodospirillales bacterium 20-64-7]HQT77344.1 hypothetical protein [Rhodopila sp.]